MKTYLLTLLFIICPLFIYAQEEHEHDTEKIHGREKAHGKLKHHRIALVWGHGYVPKGFNNSNQVKTLIIPTIGLDYEYWFSNKFAIGLSNDIELQNYVIENHEGDELEREYVYVGTIMGMFEVAHLWVIGIGPGIEVEKSDNFFVAKLTVEREFPLVGKGGWDVTPLISYELKTNKHHGVYDAFTIGIGIGKRF